MNPWGIVLLALGVLVIILGVKGTYTAVETKLTGKTHSAAGKSGGGGSSGGGGTFLNPGAGHGSIVGIPLVTPPGVNALSGPVTT